MTATKTGAPLFTEPVCDWDINKIALCYWSRFYDNIYEHPESPEDRIIENDDLLDKWVKDQAKKMDERKKENSKNSDRHKHSSTMDMPEVIIFDDAEDLLEEYRDELWDGTNKRYEEDDEDFIDEF